MFNTVATYNYPLNSNDVQTIFNWNYTYLHDQSVEHGDVQHDFRAFKPVRFAELL